MASSKPMTTPHVTETRITHGTAPEAKKEEPPVQAMLASLDREHLARVAAELAALNR